MTDVAPEVSKVSAPAAVAAKVAAGPCAVTSEIFSAGPRFSPGGLHACAIIVPREGVGGVMDMDDDCAVGWPFVETASVPPLLVVGMGAPHDVID